MKEAFNKNLGIFDDLETIVAGFLGYADAAIEEAKAAKEAEIKKLEEEICRLNGILHRNGG